MNKDFNEIDKLAKDAFENFEVDFNPEDWKRMEQKLNKKEHLMPYILLYKGTEAFVFLLIIFTAFNIWNFYADDSSNNQQTVTEVSKNQVLAQKGQIKNNSVGNSFL